MGDEINTQQRYTLSASQLKLYTTAPRKWAWRYIAKLPDTGNADARQRGILVHAHYERWIRDGVLPDRDYVDPEVPLDASTQSLYSDACRIAQHGIDFLPARTKVVAERKLDIMIGEDAKLTGKIDVSTHEGTKPAILDHKVTRSRKRMLTSETLRGDIQALLYCHMVQQSGLWLPGDVVCRWQYNWTSWDGSELDYVGVRARISEAESSAWYTTYATPIFDQMLAYRRTRAEPMDISACHSDRCKDFGGCPYRAACDAQATLTDCQEIKQMSKPGITSDMFADLKKAKEIKAAAASVVVSDPNAINPPRPVAGNKAAAPETTQAPQNPGKKEHQDLVLVDTTYCPHVTLYIDCIPINTEVVSLDEVCRDIMIDACATATAQAQQGEVADWQLAAYGRGPGYLRESATRAWSDESLPDHITCRSTSALYQAISCVLDQYVRYTVVGIR